MRPRAIALLGLGLLVAGTGCDGPKERRERAKEKLARFVLDQAPADIPHRLNIDYEGKATLLGYKVEPRGKAPPGSVVRVTLYWRCDAAIGEGWKLFSHLDAGGRMVRNLDSLGPLREKRGSGQILGPGDWQPGKVYVDEQEFEIPRKINSELVQLLTGIWKGRERLKIRKGATDGKNRGIVLTMATGVKLAPVPALEAPKLTAKQKIAIDGKLDEPAWQKAVLAGPFVDVSTGGPNKKFPVKGTVRVTWNDQALFLGFEIWDQDLRGGFDPKQPDPHLWTRDCVEIMVDPDGDGDNKDYYEIQINPQNLVFDSHFDDYNKPRGSPKGPFGHQEWSAGLQSAVKLRGTLDRSDDKDEGYTVEARIPWASFGKAKQAPPRTGDNWRMNFYAMQNDGGVAWSPILGQGNFHRASRFGKVTWTASKK